MKKIYSLTLGFILMIFVISINTFAYEKYFGNGGEQEFNYIGIRVPEDKDYYGFDLQYSIEYILTETTGDELNGAYLGTKLQSTVTSDIYYIYVWVYNNNHDDFDVAVFVAKNSDYILATDDYSIKKIIYNGNYTDGVLNTSTREALYIPEYTGVENDTWKNLGQADHYIAGTYLQTVEGALSSCDDLFYNYIITYNFIDNTLYNNKNVYYLVDYENPKSLTNILSAITVNDETKGNITLEMIVLQSNYSYDGINKVKLGEYALVVGGYDDSLNAVRQKIIIKVCDINAPIIMCDVAGIERSYLDAGLNKSEILAHFSITDNIEVKAIEVDMDEYTNNYNKVGNHTVTITATDSDSNISTSLLTISVIDTAPPMISGNSSMTTTTKQPVTKAEILAFIKVNDAVDGNITPTDIIDVNDYFNHTNQVGRYRFTVIAPDKAGNACYGSFYVEVVDKDMPTISVNSDYVISILTTESLSKEAIISLFQGKSNKTIVNLSSEYFNSDFPVGEYSVILTFDDGSIEQGVIKLSELEAIEAVAPNNTSYYAYIGACGAVLALGVGYFIFKRLKKRH